MLGASYEYGARIVRIRSAPGLTERGLDPAVRPGICKSFGV